MHSIFWVCFFFGSCHWCGVTTPLPPLPPEPKHCLCCHVALPRNHQFWCEHTAASPILQQPLSIRSPIAGMSALSMHRASLHCVLGEVQEKKCTGGFYPLSRRGTRMNPPSWLPKTAAHVTQTGFSEELSLQRLLFAFPLSAAASHLDARQKRRKKKNPLPPPAEQPLNQNKAGAAAKSWEALLFNAQHPPARPARPGVLGAGAGAPCGQCGGCRAGEEGASSATSPRASSAT